MPRRLRSAALAAAFSLAGCAMDAKAERVVVVGRAGAGEVERFAADELRRYLGTITGQRVAVEPQGGGGALALLVGRPA